MSTLIKAAMWTGVAIFFADVVRRCWVIEAWSLLPMAAIAVLFALVNVRAAWRSRRRRTRPADFLRIKTPHFPEQPRRGGR